MSARTPRSALHTGIVRMLAAFAALALLVTACGDDDDAGGDATVDDVDTSDDADDGGEDDSADADAAATGGGDDDIIQNGNGAAFISLTDGRSESFPTTCSFYRDQFEVTFEAGDDSDDHDFSIYYREQDGTPDDAVVFSYSGPDFTLNALSSDAFRDVSFNGSDMAATIDAQVGLAGETAEVAFNASCVPG